MRKGPDQRDTQPVSGTRPLIAITPWRRTLSTFVHPETDLYTLAPYYTDAVSSAGGQSAVVPAADNQEAAEEMMDRFDGLILSGGDDLDPSLYGQENLGSHGPDKDSDLSDIRMLQAAISQNKPVLAICRGVQLANVALGGSLRQDIWGTSSSHPARANTGDATADADAFLANRHTVSLESDSVLAQVLGCTTTETNSLHHQSIDTVADELRVVATADDGIVEAVEHKSHSLLAVQWHPERLPQHQPLFDWLTAEAAGHPMQREDR